MGDLFGVPVLLMTKSAPATWQITDEAGAPLAYVELVAGHQRGRLGRAFRADNNGRLVLGVRRPDGSLVCYLDRSPTNNPLRPRPVAVVDPATNTPVGWLLQDRQRNAQERLAWIDNGGLDAVMTGRAGVVNTGTAAYLLVDAANQVLGELRSTPWQVRRGNRDGIVSNANDFRTEGGDVFTAVDARGAQLAEFNWTGQVRLQLAAQLPEPLRSLVVLSPVAVSLSVDVDG